MEICHGRPFVCLCVFVVVVFGILASKESANSPRGLLGFIMGGLAFCSQARDRWTCARARPLRACVSNWRRPAGFYSGALAASLVWQISLGLPLVCPAPPPPPWCIVCCPHPHPGILSRQYRSTGSREPASSTAFRVPAGLTFHSVGLAFHSFLYCQ